MKQNLAKDDVLRISLGETLSKLSSFETGISQNEVESRLKIYGPNVIKKNKLSAVNVLFRQLQSSLIYLLAIASIISFWIRDYYDGTIILIILLVNTLLSFFQEYRAEKTVEELSKFITSKVRILRDGSLVLLDQSQIVPGDVIIIREGDIVPADIRLIKSDGLQINDSQLTGESVPVPKIVKENGRDVEAEIVFAGSIVEKGEGTGVVYATGDKTEFGNIATLSRETKKKTQYEKSLQSFSSFLMKVVVLGLVLVFAFKLFLNGGLSNVVELLLFIIATAVAVVPEVLPVIATVSLSSGALKLAKKHVVVKRLSSLEDLGNVTILCTDKTGTITENKMTIKKITSDDENLFQKLAYAAITPVKGRKRRTENSYDDAFLNYVSLAIEREAKNLTIVKELPFDPDDKRRRVVLEDNEHKKHYLVIIGAPEVLMKISSKGHKDHYLKNIENEGKEGIHHLALSYREVEYTDTFDILKNEHSLTFLGFVSLHDPLRQTAKSAILHAEKMGVKIKILTGDSREVAEYIGREVGLLGQRDKVYVGSDLEKMSEYEFKRVVAAYSVFARVSPTQKYNIIKALKETNVVAYQGDGINDAPSLKLADVAIAVNTATDIAKESSDIVILNESLDVIINGIKYGRSIFVNINKYIKYTMISNFGNFIALSVLYLISSANLPMLPVQVLLTTVITDIPLISVSSDTVEDEDVEKPEKHNVKDLILISIILGIPTALFELFYYMIIRNQPQIIIETSLFVFITFLSLIVFYTIRDKHSFWKAKAPSTLINILFLIDFIVSIGIVYIPQTQSWFSFAPLAFIPVITILILMAAYFFVADVIKVWYYKRIDFFDKKLI